MEPSSKTAPNAHSTPGIAEDCVFDPNAKTDEQGVNCCPKLASSAENSKTPADKPKPATAKEKPAVAAKPRKRRRIRKKVASKVSGGKSDSNNALLIGGGIALAVLLLKTRRPQVSYRMPSAPRPRPPIPQPPQIAEQPRVIVE